MVSALTLPTLISNHQEKVLITQLNVSYNQLSQATRQIVIDKNGGIDNIWGEYPEKTYWELMPKYIKLTKVSISKASCCRNRAGGMNYINTDNIYRLPSGAEISAGKMDAHVGSTYTLCNIDSNFKIRGGNTKGNTYFNSCGGFTLDVNGFGKGPDTWGKDVFSFYFVMDDIVPAGMPNDGVWCQIFDECLKPDSPYGGNCAAWVIINKNMDYLRCPDKLGWKKASSCE